MSTFVGRTGQARPAGKPVAGQPEPAAKPAQGRTAARKTAKGK